MTLLTRKVDYAILVMSYLHGHSEGAMHREIAVRFGLSRAFVANILKELCTKGYVSSHRGVNGGYALLRPRELVTLAEFIDALEQHSMQLAACTQSEPGDGCSLIGSCPVVANRSPRSITASEPCSIASRWRSYSAAGRESKLNC